VHIKLKLRPNKNEFIFEYIFLVGAHVLEAFVRNLKSRRNETFSSNSSFLSFTGVVVVVVVVDVLVVVVEVDDDVSAVK
jgi:uncharacterized membrane protein YeaQ/YmgE (transglycosylase-associated protein family)